MPWVLFGTSHYLHQCRFIVNWAIFKNKYSATNIPPLSCCLPYCGILDHVKSKVYSLGLSDTRGKLSLDPISSVVAEVILITGYIHANSGFGEGRIDEIFLIASSWGQHGAYLGPTGPRWAPCWPHEPCYLGYGLVCRWAIIG